MKKKRWEDLISLLRHTISSRPAFGGAFSIPDSNCSTKTQRLYYLCYRVPRSTPEPFNGSGISSTHGYLPACVKPLHGSCVAYVQWCKLYGSAPSISNLVPSPLPVRNSNLRCLTRNGVLHATIFFTYIPMAPQIHVERTSNLAP
jgi:hypothetical protein